MGVVIEICAKRPGGPTRIRVTEIQRQKTRHAPVSRLHKRLPSYAAINKIKRHSGINSAFAPDRFYMITPRAIGVSEFVG
jgi:hypothetical protein